MRNDLPLTVIGNLVDDPELRFTSAGVPVARFTVASTPRSYDRDTNTWWDGEPTFLDCSAWRQLAENLAESNVTKGTRVVVAGRLRTDRWETPVGEKRSRMVMNVDDVGASMTFATVTIARTTRGIPPRETAPDDPWTTASRTRPQHSLPPTPPTPLRANRRSDSPGPSRPAEAPTAAADLAPLDAGPGQPAPQARLAKADVMPRTGSAAWTPVSELYGRKARGGGSSVCELRRSGPWW